MSELTKTIEASRQFEDLLMEKEKNLKKLAWFMVSLFAFIAVLAIVAIIVMLPLKTTDVDLYTIDKQTGRVEYVTKVTELNLSSADALNHAFAASYVNRREHYNYFELQNDYDVTQLFNSGDVNKSYLEWFNGPDAPDTVFNKAEYVVNVSVISNVHSRATAPDNLARLRIKRTIRKVSDGIERTEFWNIHLTYRYIPTKELTDAEREANPLGWIVTSYQRDKELRAE